MCDHVAQSVTSTMSSIALCFRHWSSPMQHVLETHLRRYGPPLFLLTFIQAEESHLKSTTSLTLVAQLESS